MSEDIWVVGRAIGKGKGGIVWALQGLFSTKEQAVSACRNYTYFIGHIPFGIAFPEDIEPLPGFEYPIRAEVILSASTP